MCESCFFFLLFLAIWRYWLPGGEISVHFGFSGTYHTARCYLGTCYCRRLRGFRRLWPRLLSCVLLELFLVLQLSTCLIGILLQTTQARLISFHDAVNSPSFSPPSYASPLTSLSYGPSAGWDKEHCTHM